MTAATFVDVELGDAEQIMLFVDAEANVAGDVAHQSRPIDEPCGDGQSCAGENSGVLVAQRLDVHIHEAVDLGHGSARS